jgi:hypothetical protein
MFEGISVLAVALLCPLVMGGMMLWMMRKGRGDGRPSERSDERH